MACTWGATSIKVLVEQNYQPPYIDPNISEIKILCDPATPNTPASVLQGNGCDREIVSYKAYVSTYAAYLALKADKRAMTVRTWTGPAGDTMSAVITSLVPEYIQDDCVFFNITLKEAD